MKSPEGHDQLRPCLNVFIREDIDVDMKAKVGEEILKTVEREHGKHYPSDAEDQRAWLVFINKGDLTFEVLSDRGEQLNKSDTKIQPGVVFDIEMRKSATENTNIGSGTVGMLIQNTVTFKTSLRALRLHFCLSCTHCVLPPDYCNMIVRKLKLYPRKGNDKALALHFDTWKKNFKRKPSRSVPYTVSPVKCNNPSSPECQEANCKCQEAKCDSQCQQRWWTMSTLFPSKTTSHCQEYMQYKVGTKNCAYAGVAHGWFPTKEMSFPFFPGSPTVAKSKGGRVIHSPRLNVDVGALFVNHEDLTGEHSIQDVQLPNGLRPSRWNIAERFVDIFHDFSPDKCAKIPVYALLHESQSIMKVCDKPAGGVLFVSGQGYQSLEKGDSGVLLFTINGTEATVLGMLSAGDSEKKVYFIMPLHEAIKLLTPQLNYFSATLCKKMAGEEEKVALERYIERFEKAEWDKINCPTESDEERCKCLQQCYSRQLNEEHTDISFCIMPCLDHCVVTESQVQPNTHPDTVNPEQVQPNTHPDTVNPEQVQPNTHPDTVNPEQVQPKTHQATVNPEQVQPNTHPDTVNPEQVQPNTHPDTVNPEQVQPNTHPDTVNPEQVQPNTHPDTVNPEQVQPKTHQATMNPESCNDTILSSSPMTAES